MSQKKNESRNDYNVKVDRLIVPVYINEKIVLDMLAILEDGFSMVSQIQSSERAESVDQKSAGGELGTTAMLLSKLLKIDFAADLSMKNADITGKSISQEKIHTNVSLLSKLRDYLVEVGALKTGFIPDDVQVGDFIEVKGELQKNPFVNYLKKFLDMYKLGVTLTEQPQLGSKADGRKKKAETDMVEKQIRALVDDLKHSGTIDFILADDNYTAVLSAQEQYLENDNVSEKIGGQFKVLGKVIATYKNKEDSVDLLRKTTMSVLPENMLNELFSDFTSGDVAEFNLPELITKINGPAVIVIPVAIYA